MADVSDSELEALEVDNVSCADSHDIDLTDITCADSVHIEEDEGGNLCALPPPF